MDEDLDSTWIEISSYIAIIIANVNVNVYVIVIVATDVI